MQKGSGERNKELIRLIENPGFETLTTPPIAVPRWLPLGLQIISNVAFPRVVIFILVFMNLK